MHVHVVIVPYMLEGRNETVLKHNIVDKLQLLHSENLQLHVQHDVATFWYNCAMLQYIKKCHEF